MADGLAEAQGLPGEHALRYEKNLKRRLVEEFRQMLGEWLSYCWVRYAF